MSKNGSFKIVRFAAMLIALCCLSGIVLTQEKPPPKPSTQEEARKLWEASIAAKGGRERLLGVKNIVISSSAEYTTHKGKDNSIKEEELFVLPDKKWSWEDYRPDVFELRVEMFNYEAK